MQSETSYQKFPSNLLCRKWSSPFQQHAKWAKQWKLRPLLLMNNRKNFLDFIACSTASEGSWPSGSIHSSLLLTLASILFIWYWKMLTHNCVHSVMGDIPWGLTCLLKENWPDSKEALSECHLWRCYNGYVAITFRRSDLRLCFDQQVSNNYSPWDWESKTFLIQVLSSY